MAVFTGIWRVSFDPVEAGGPYNVTAAAENSTAALTDVLFGDIWLCGGQSNMYFSTSQVGRAGRTPACLCDELLHVSINVQRKSICRAETPFTYITHKTEEVCIS